MQLVAKTVCQNSEKSFVKWMLWEW
jgi:hypothetical protein